MSLHHAASLHPRPHTGVMEGDGETRAVKETYNESVERDTTRPEMKWMKRSDEEKVRD